MKRILVVALAIIGAGSEAGFGQVSGNIAYAEAGGKGRAEQAERARRVLTKDELPPDATSTFLDASVLINVKADEYVATFALAQEGKTVAECQAAMEATLARFKADLQALGVAAEDLFVDFVAQNRIYGYEVEAEVARERLTGFELKKNVSIHYKDHDLLDRLIAAAARSEIFDLIKVDYVVTNPTAVQDRLLERAAEILKRKAARHEKLLGLTLDRPSQILAERYSMYSPGDLYDSYTAAETEDLAVAVDRQKYTIQGVRKARTFFFNGLDGDGFDEVINPVVIEPVVQFTLYLKARYYAKPGAGD